MEWGENMSTLYLSEQQKSILDKVLLYIYTDLANHKIVEGIYYMLYEDIYTHKKMLNFTIVCNDEFGTEEYDYMLKKYNSAKCIKDLFLTLGIRFSIKVDNIENYTLASVTPNEMLSLQELVNSKVLFDRTNKLLDIQYYVNYENYANLKYCNTLEVYPLMVHGFIAARKNIVARSLIRK